MRATIISVLAAASVVSAQSSTIVPAPKMTGNPIGASYVATLPQKPGSSLQGTIQASSAPDGNSVAFSVSFSGLPTTGGPLPFIYHIHQYPVPSDGNCTGTGAHLDPTNRGETPPCDSSQPQTCQVGDLSGKYGNFSSVSFSDTYNDPYVSLNPSSNAFFGNLSFVLHYANKTRIACANFTSVGYSTQPTTTMSIPKPSASGNSTVPTYTAVPVPQYTGAAAKVLGSSGAALVAAAALLL